MKTTAFEQIQFQDHVEQENKRSTLCKDSDVELPLQPPKQQLPTDAVVSEVVVIYGKFAADGW